MKIIVTGGAGFIGSHLADALINKGHEVIVLDNLATGNKKNINQKAKFIELAIEDIGVGKVFQKEKPDVVYHLAAQIDLRKSVTDPMFDANSNILGTINILENSKKHNVSKVVFASTGGAIYGDASQIPTKENYPPKPISPYSIAKLTGENYLFYYQKIFGLDYVTLRYGNVYGPRQRHDGEAGVIAIFTSKLLNGEIPTINGDGTKTRDYVYVHDVVRANLLALDKPGSGIYNVGTSIQTDVNKIFKLIAGEIVPDIEPHHGPDKPGEQETSCLDIELIKEKLGWEPEVKIDEGIKETVKWFKANI